MFARLNGRRYAGREFVVGCFVLLSVVMIGVSCSDDDPVRTNRPTPATKNYQNLTQRDHVLNNLELCYIEQNINEYARLLDDPNFTYYFSDADFADGKTPEFWDRSEDINRQGKMFDLNYNGEYKVISIQLSLQYPAGQWIETTPDQNEFPGEEWYFKSVTYDLTLIAEAQPENITFLAQGLKALFTVRQSEFEGEQKWRIVEWRDDIQQ